MRLLITLSILLFSGNVFAQQSLPNPDSIAYQLQRKKINDMLSQRVLRFGQYTESLNKHSGIFGIQTKNDIRRSNDILMDIIKTDNGILEQTKILLSLKDNQLNYRSYQQQTVESKAKETQDVSLGFMNTINKLRAQNEKLTVQLKSFEDSQNLRKWTIAIFVVIIGLILFTTLNKRRNKA